MSIDDCCYENGDFSPMGLEPPECSLNNLALFACAGHMEVLPALYKYEREQLGMLNCEHGNNIRQQVRVVVSALFWQVMQEERFHDAIEIIFQETDNSFDKNDCITSRIVSMERAITESSLLKEEKDLLMLVLRKAKEKNEKRQRAHSTAHNVS